MKKLIIIALMLISASAFSQAYYVNYTKVRDNPVFTLSKDTNVIISRFSDAALTNGYIWTSQFVWSGADSLNASISVEISMDGVNYVAYPGLSAISLNTSAGTAVLRDISTGVFEMYFKIKILHGTNTAGTLKYYEHLMSKK